MYRDMLAGALKPPRRAPLVDPRVARHGGTRRDPRSNYDFEGIASDSDWRKTRIHKATRFYGCFLCGREFTGPHAAYTHLAKVHDR